MILLDIDPNVVKPGWTPLVITIALAVVIALLYVSMKRQVRRINVLGSTPLAAEEETTDATAETDVSNDATSESVASVDEPTPTGSTPSSTPTG